MAMRSWVLQGIASVLVLAAGGAAMFALAASAESVQKQQKPEVTVVVTSAAVEAHADVVVLETNGEVVPAREIVLSAEVGGRVIHRDSRAEAGRYVTPDKELVLIEIDPRDYQLEITRLESELAQAEGSLNELDVEQKNTEQLVALARKQFELQESQYARRKQLFERGSLTEGTLDEAEQARLTAENSLAMLENQVRLFEARKRRLQDAIELVKAQLERAELDLERTQIRSPVSGVVITDHVEEDDFVGRGDALLTIEDTSSIEVQCKLTPSQLYWVWAQESIVDPNAIGDIAGRGYTLPKTPVKVNYRVAGRMYQWSGYLDRYQGLGLDPVTRTIPCRVVVENPRAVNVVNEETQLADPMTNRPAGSMAGPPALVRGMFVGLEIETRPQVDLLSVPRSALRPDGTIWQLDDENRVHRFKAKAAHHLDDFVLLHADQTKLTDGMRVVTSPAAMLYEGQQVDIAESEAKISGDSIAAADANAPPAENAEPTSDAETAQ
jgi:multidrug resistance efflux pump